MSVLESLRKQLASNASEAIRLGSQRYFKEPVKCYGIKTEEVTRIAKELGEQLRKKEKNEIFVLCDELWQSGYMEESFIACNLAYERRKQFTVSDFGRFNTWVSEYVSNWASCDTLCNHTIGSFLEMFPEQIENLKKWAVSENRWVRRAAAVSLIIPARKGLFLNEIFSIAQILLRDQDDMVQKGYGWMLKAASQASSEEVFSFVMENRQQMPRTALRYAIEKMPADWKQMAMAKH